MCARISLFAELGDLADQFRFDPGMVEAAYQLSWNIAPTGLVLAVAVGDGERRAVLMRWGFTFQGKRSGGGSSRPLFNARSETVAERSAFRGAFAQRRCLVPVNGFYEWRNGNGVKTPLWIHRSDEKPFALAGIFNGGQEPAASVITCAPNFLMESIHNRMPVMLDAEHYDSWLDPEASPEALQSLLAPREWPDITAHPVSGTVNRGDSEGPQLIAPANNAAPTLL